MPWRRRSLSGATVGSYGVTSCSLRHALALPGLDLLDLAEPERLHRLRERREQELRPCFWPCVIAQ